MSNVFITQSEFAKLMGVSKQAVSKAIKEKRLTQVIDYSTGKLMLNPEMATAEWSKKTEMRIENSQMGANYRPIGGQSPDDPANEDDGISKETGGLYKAKTDKERIQAKILELEYKELTGELIPADRVKKDAFKLARLLREAVLNVPARICNELAAETDPFKVHQKLSTALTAALSNMVEEALLADADEEETPEDIEEDTDEENPE
jgi:transcriptional regulator with XRE-family HTH domain